jgi:hypothetical protein
MGLFDAFTNPEQAITNKMKDFLLREAEANNVTQDKVLLASKFKEVDGKMKLLHYIQVNGAFKRYVQIKELL